MASLKDVAKKAGVSSMTVSRVLNNPEKVKTDTKNKVMNAINELGYKVNLGASSLASKKTGIIQIVISSGLSLRDMYFLELFSGISEVLCEKKYSLSIQYDVDSMTRCDGMIIMGLDKNKTDLLKNVDEPFVIFGKHEGRFDCVDVNNYVGTSLLANELVEKGHKDIIYANFETNEPFIEERKAGYNDVLKENGLKPFEFHVLNSAHENDWTEILKDKKYTAIMCASDLIALGLINHFKETGIKVPSEVSVTGFDGVQYHNISNPHITTAKQPLYEIGRRLAEVLLEKIYYGEIFMNVFENFDPRIENLGDSIERK